MSEKEEKDKLICPQCGSSDWDVRDLLYFYGPSSGWLLVCNQCHHEWEYHTKPGGNTRLVELDLEKGTVRFVEENQSRSPEE
jgi:hypothetical protein